MAVFSNVFACGCCGGNSGGNPGKCGACASMPLAIDVTGTASIVPFGFAMIDGGYEFDPLSLIGPPGIATWYGPVINFVDNLGNTIQAQGGICCGWNLPSRPAFLGTFAYWQAFGFAGNRALPAEWILVGSWGPNLIICDPLLMTPLLGLYIGIYLLNFPITGS